MNSERESTAARSRQDTLSNTGACKCLYTETTLPNYDF
jgi:hypothetical protein